MNLGYNNNWIIIVSTCLPVCSKIISFWAREVLSIAKAICFHVLFMVLHHLQLLAVSVSLVSILHAGNWAKISTVARHCLSQPQISTRIKFNGCPEL